MIIFKSDNYYEKLGWFAFFPIIAFPLVGTLIFEDFKLGRTIVLSAITLCLIVFPLIGVIRKTYTIACLDSEIIVTYAYRRNKIEKYPYVDLVSISFNSPGKDSHCLFIFEGNIKRKVALYFEQKTKIENLMSHCKAKNEHIQFFAKPSGDYTYDWLNKALRKYKS